MALNMLYAKSYAISTDRLDRQCIFTFPSSTIVPQKCPSSRVPSSRVHQAVCHQGGVCHHGESDVGLGSLSALRVGLVCGSVEWQHDAGVGSGSLQEEVA